MKNLCLFAMVFALTVISSLTHAQDQKPPAPAVTERRLLVHEEQPATANAARNGLQELNALALDGLEAYVESLKQPVHKNEGEATQLDEQLKTLELTAEILKFEEVTVPVPSELQKWAIRINSIDVKWKNSKEWNPAAAFSLISNYLSFGESLDSEQTRSFWKSDPTYGRLLKSAEGKKGKEAALAVVTEAIAAATEARKARIDKIDASNKHIADLEAKTQELRKRFSIPAPTGPESDPELERGDIDLRLRSPLEKTKNTLP